MSNSDTASESSHVVLSQQVLTSLMRLGTVKDFPSGSTVFERATVGEEMYVIEAGEVELDFGTADKANKRLRAGQFFGEFALITGNHRRTAGVVVPSHASLRVIDQAAFNQFVEREPQAAVALLRATCLYLLQAERSLIEGLQLRNAELTQALDYLRRTKQELSATELRALTDELTGLYNRRCLNERCDAALADAQQSKRRLSLLVADLDYFKAINDTFGHPVGDQVLVRFAKALKEALRQTDLPCRTGGDEFAAILFDLCDEDAAAIAVRLLRQVRTLGVPGQQRGFSCTIGVATAQPADDWSGLVARADQSLYLAKEHGRNCVGWNGQVLGALSPHDASAAALPPRRAG